MTLIFALKIFVDVELTTRMQILLKPKDNVSILPTLPIVTPTTNVLLEVAIQPKDVWQLLLLNLHNTSTTSVTAILAF
jgi:hypothetical protein